MSFKKLEPPDLSSARINRLLRPLRSRCSSLATYSSSRTRRNLNLNTYSSRGGPCNLNELSAPAPLFILPQPGSLGSRQYMDSDQAEMAKRVYAIRDCFQDIVINTGRYGIEGETCRIPSLAALCSIIVGVNIEDQVANGEDDEEDDHEGNLYPTDKLYDSIPIEYRRCTLLSHALKIILTHSGDNPTLLTRLLDITLDHKLDYESASLVQSLIRLALTPDTIQKVPLICHPAHSNFFVDISTRWNASGASYATLFRILITALERSHDHNAWASKAVHNVAQVMCSRDFASYLRLISVSSTFAVASRTASLEQVTGRSVHSRILAWIKIILDRKSSLSAVVSETSEAMGGCSADMGDMLTCALPLACNSKTSFTREGLHSDIQAHLLSLATQWLTGQQPSSQNLIIEQLSTTLPRTSTFIPLVTKIFRDSGKHLKLFRAAINEMASTLHTSGLLHLNASLLACALRFIEDPSHERELVAGSSASEIQSYRHQLISQADDAEDKFVRPRARPVAQSHVNKACAIATPLRRDMFRDISEWEPRTGSWLRKSEDNRPARKRRKFVREISHESLHYNTRSRALSYMDPDDVNKDARYLPGPKPIFSALLSCAASKRAILHPVRKLPCIRSQSEEPDRASSDDEGISDDDIQLAVSFSDDALDLFAWASSSPVKSR